MADAVAEGEDDDQLLLTMPLFEEQIAALRRRVAMHPVHGAARSEMSSCVGIFVVCARKILRVPAELRLILPSWPMHAAGAATPSVHA